jgi:hypothetical protein
MTIVGLLNLIGLGLNLLGALLLGIVVQRGIEAGYERWENAGRIGWALFVVGFLSQFVAACFTDFPPRP